MKVGWVCLARPRALQPFAGSGPPPSRSAPRLPQSRMAPRISLLHDMKGSHNSWVKGLQVLGAQDTLPPCFLSISGVQLPASRTALSTLSSMLPNPSLSCSTSEWLSTLLHACPPAGKKGLGQFDILLIRRRVVRAGAPGSYQEQVESAELMTREPYYNIVHS